MLGQSSAVAVSAALLFALAPAARGTAQDAGREADRATLAHGPMLGQVTASSIRVWGRTDQPAALSVRYGLDPQAMDQQSTSVPTAHDHDLTQSLTIEGLLPDCRYHYQMLVDGHPAGLAGSFRTLPSPDQHRDPQYNPDGLFNFRFQFGSCANQNPLHGIGPSLPAYDTMLRDVADRVYFAIMNGDWLYEEQREYPVDGWLQAAGLTAAQMPRIVRLAPTIVGVWENYKLYLDRAPNLAQWHRQVPTVFTVDDHELVNDIRGAGTTGFRERRAVFRDIGMHAWFDYLAWANPVEHSQPPHFGRAALSEGSDVLEDPSADFTALPLDQLANLHVHWGTPEAGVNDMLYDTQPADPNAGVYEIVEVLGKHRLRIKPQARADSQSSYSIGRRTYGKFRISNCEFYLLDTKSHRQMHDAANPSRPGLTMLGDHQRRWLLESMSASDAEFFFVVSSVNFTIPHSGAGGVEMAEGKDEAWTALLDEREKLITAWDQLGKPVMVLTADLHNSFAIRITDTVWEFGSGPHNSVNHAPANDEGDRPATGQFQSGPRTVDIRWSSYVLADLPRLQRLYPHYCVAQVNNVFNMPQQLGGKRSVAYPHPQVIFQYFDGRTGEMVYSETITLPDRSGPTVGREAKSQ